MTEPRTLPAFAWRPVTIVTAIVVAALGATANEYGYHRDELYFRMLGAHPAWSYIDEPPMTPLLVRAATGVFGDSVWALRVPAIISAAATIVIVALIARELGGRGYAQTIAAIGATASFLLAAGHVMLTASPDMVVWTLTILFIARALLRHADRYWIYAGVAVGLGLYNKQLILLLLIGLAVGLLISGPRDVLTSRALWLGVAIAVVIALPTFIYQIVDHFPELKMSRAIAADKGPSDRIAYLPFQLAAVVALWIYGFVGMFTVPAWRRVRALAWAYVVVSVIVLVTGGQMYYSFGLLAFFMAAAAVRLETWVVPSRVRQTWVVAALTVATLIWAVIALPLVPARSFGSTPIGAINQASRDSFGWPAYVQQVAAAYRTLSPADQAQTTVIAENYGEAGALDKFGGAYRLPHVYSAQNQLYLYGPPPASATIAVLVGYETTDVSNDFASCATVGRLDDKLGVDNEEQGNPITICRTPTQSWAALWPSLRHYS